MLKYLKYLYFTEEKTQSKIILKPSPVRRFTQYIFALLGKPEKKFFFVTRSLRRGGGVKDLAIKKKELFLKLLNKISPQNVATKFEVGREGP